MKTIITIQFLTTYLASGLIFAQYEVVISSIGATLAMAMIGFGIAEMFVAFGTPIYAMLADYTGRPKNVLQIALLGRMIFAFLMFALNDPFYTTLAFIGFNAFGSGVPSLTDRIVLPYCEENGLQYGRMRSAGSFAYAINGFVFGMIISIFGAPIYSFFIGGCLFVLGLINSTRLPNITISAEDKAKSNGFFNDIKGLFKNKIFIFTLISSVVLFSETIIFYNLLNNHIRNGLGYAPMQAVTIAAICTFTGSFITEVFALRHTDYLRSKYGASNLILTAGIISIIRWFIIGTTNNVVILILAMGLHGPTFAFLLPSAMTIYSKNVNPNVVATAFSLSEGAFGLITGLAAIFLAGITQKYGTHLPVLMFSLISIIPVILTLKLRKIEGLIDN